MVQVVDTYPTYRLDEVDLRAYLESLFPKHKNAIQVSRGSGTKNDHYVFKTPFALTPKQKSHIETLKYQDPEESSPFG